MVNQNNPNVELRSRKCAHLGLLEDDKTWSSAVAELNHCHARGKPAPVDWQHQCAYCFNDDFLNCPVRKSLAAGEARPARTWETSKWVAITAAALVFLALLVGGIVYRWGFPPLFLFVQASSAQTVSASAQPTQTDAPLVTATAPQQKPTRPAAVVNIPSHTPTVMPTATAVATATVTLAPPATSTAVPATASAAPSIAAGSPTPGPAVETPFGAPAAFVVHQVASGEYWERLASRYDTTVEVLQRLNGMDFSDVLYIEKIIVILPGIKDPGSVQPHTALYLVRETAVQALVETYHMPEEQFRAENGLGNETTIPARRWIVVPVIP